MSFHNHGQLNHKLGAQPLDLDQLRALAPSIFAEGKHESRSEKYTYIPTEDVVRGMMTNGFQPTFAKQGKSRIEGKAAFTKHLIRFRHPDLRPSKVHDTFPEVTVMNSHDGTSAWQIFFALFRLTCLNGNYVADQTVAEQKVSHRGDVTHQVIDASYRVIEDVKRIGDIADQWQGTDLRVGERVALAEAAHELRFEGASNQMRDAIQPLTLLAARRWEDRDGTDLWTTFNKIQENIIKGHVSGRLVMRNGRTGRMQEQTVTTRPIKGIDQDVKLNRALWVLGQRMAELKGATA